MNSLWKHWPRIAVTLLPLLVALLHTIGVARIGVLQRFDDIIYDARLRATMPKTLDSRIVIVDIDEKSLAEVGRWPWGRNRMAELTRELFDRHQVALLGFDVVFAEVDDSSGLKQLNELASSELKAQPGFVEKVKNLQERLDYDAAFAKALKDRPVVLGYYLTSDREGRASGVLPAPVMSQSSLQGRPIRFTSWNGYGANIEQLARAAPMPPRPRRWLPARSLSRIVALRLRTRHRRGHLRAFLCQEIAGPSQPDRHRREQGRHGR